MSVFKISKSLFTRLGLGLKVMLDPTHGGYAKPDWLTGRETFDLPVDTLSGVFRNLYEFELTGTDREWKQILFYNEMIQKSGLVPGDVAEFGVSGGVSLMAFCRLLKIYERGLDNKEKKHIFGFDSFDGLPDLHDYDLSEKVSNQDMHSGGFKDSIGYTYLLKFVEKQDNVSLKKGWFDNSLPEFIKENPSTMFSLVHIDCDLYKSTMVVLQNVWELVSPGGIIVFDELFHKDFPGETKAFSEFFKNKSGSFTLRKSLIKPDKKYIVKH